MWPVWGLAGSIGHPEACLKAADLSVVERRVPTGVADAIWQTGIRYGILALERGRVGYSAHLWKASQPGRTQSVQSRLPARGGSSVSILAESRMDHRETVGLWQGVGTHGE